MRKILIPGFLILASTLSGCSIYKPEIQQGNLLDTQEIKKLKPGMTKRQVTHVMGTPLLKDPFHSNRWDYIHTKKPGDGKLVRQRVTLHFENGVLARIDTSDLKEQVLE